MPEWWMIILGGIVAFLAGYGTAALEIDVKRWLELRRYRR